MVCKAVSYLFFDTFNADICPIHICYQVVLRFQCCSVCVCVCVSVCVCVTRQIKLLIRNGSWTKMT